MNITSLAKYAFLCCEGIPTYRPKFDVFHPTANQGVNSERVELTVKYLKEKKVKKNKGNESCEIWLIIALHITYLLTEGVGDSAKRLPRALNIVQLGWGDR